MSKEYQDSGGLNEFIESNLPKMHNAKGSKKKRLSTYLSLKESHRTFVDGLSVGKTLADAYDYAFGEDYLARNGVEMDRTVMRTGGSQLWSKEEIKLALDEVKDMMIEMYEARVLSATEMAISTLEDVMRYSESESNRIKSAQIILNKTLPDAKGSASNKEQVVTNHTWNFGGSIDYDASIERAKNSIIKDASKYEQAVDAEYEEK